MYNPKRIMMEKIIRMIKITKIHCNEENYLMDYMNHRPKTWLSASIFESSDQDAPFLYRLLSLRQSKTCKYPPIHSQASPADQHCTSIVKRQFRTESYRGRQNGCDCLPA